MAGAAVVGAATAGGLVEKLGGLVAGNGLGLAVTGALGGIVAGMVGAIGLGGTGTSDPGGVLFTGAGSGGTVVGNDGEAGYLSLEGIVGTAGGV